MKTQAKYLASLASLSVLLFTTQPAQATSWDVAFYELTEELSFGQVPGTEVQTRIGAGALAGEARIGKSPLCPQALVDALVAGGFAKKNKSCYVTATGRDEIRLDNLSGTFEADIRVKVQGDNPVDAP